MFELDNTKAEEFFNSSKNNDAKKVIERYQSHKPKEGVTAPFKGGKIMRKIIKERGAGKTYELVKLSAEKQIPILCMDQRYILDIAKELNVKIPEPISVWEYKRGFHEGKKIDEILVDDSEFILQSLLGIPIHALTITKPKEITKKEIANIIGVNVNDFVIVE